MTYALSDHAHDFFEKVNAGEKILWHQSLKWLHCFSHSFSGDWNSIAAGGYYEMFEPYYFTTELHKPAPERSIAGIKFTCAEAQLVKRSALAGRDLSQGLPVLDLLHDAIDFMRHYSTMPREQWEPMSRQLLAFVENEMFVVPPKVLLEMIESTGLTHHGLSH